MRQNIWPVWIWLFYYMSRQLQNPFSSQIPVVLILTELPVCPACVSRLINQSLNWRKHGGFKQYFSLWETEIEILSRNHSSHVILKLTWHIFCPHSWCQLEISERSAAFICKQQFCLHCWQPFAWFCLLLTGSCCISNLKYFVFCGPLSFLSNYRSTSGF